MTGKQLGSFAQARTPKRIQKTSGQADNPIEIIKDLSTHMAKSAVSDVFGGIATSATEQLGLKPQKRTSGTLNPNEDFFFEETGKTTEEEYPFLWTQEKPAYRPPEQPIFSAKDLEIQRKIEEILKELKALAKSVDKVSQEASKMAIEEMPPRPGVYHLNFFEWMLKLIKAAKTKVDESAVWLSLFRSRKKEKEYWAMFKKHGTTFGLSYERVVATQTG